MNFTQYFPFFRKLFEILLRRIPISHHHNRGASPPLPQKNNNSASGGFAPNTPRCARRTPLAALAVPYARRVVVTCALILRSSCFLTLKTWEQVRASLYAIFLALLPSTSLRFVLASLSLEGDRTQAAAVTPLEFCALSDRGHRPAAAGRHFATAQPAFPYV